MKKYIIKNKKSQQECHYEEAHALFIKGWDLERIGGKLSMPVQTLEEWQKVGHWERKKELVTEHPKLIGETLKGLVKQKFKNLLVNENELNINNIEELNKILSLIERLEEQSWDERAVVVEVMSLFGNFVRRQVEEKEELKILTKMMEKFFEEMEGT